MKYKPPIKDNKPLYVPIVTKSKDYLVGYIHAMNLFKEVFEVSLSKMGIEIDTSDFEMCLDSSRFNDIMRNDERSSNCSKEEIKQHLKEMFESKVIKMKEHHPDNESKVLENIILKIECPCGLGFYSFENIKDIPEEPLKCSTCGRLIIDYTGHYDNDYEFDGERL